MLNRAVLFWLAGLTVSSLQLVSAGEEHHHHHGSHERHSDHSAPPAPGPLDTLPYYFAHPDHKGLLYGHVALMSVGWIVVLPIAVVLAIAGSRYHLPTQLLFLIIHGSGLFLSILYNSATPDLYPNNSHHKLGWAIVWILATQSILGVLGRTIRFALCAGNLGGTREETSGFIPVPAQDPEDHHHHRTFQRHSTDSGQGSDEYRSRSPSTSSLENRRYGNFEGVDLPLAEGRANGKVTLVERLTSTSWLESFLSRHLPYLLGLRVLRISDALYSLIARFLVVLGFVQISLGIVTASGIFMESRVFNGLAHFIKGGIFFLYGVLTLGRWLGAFSELGWAWNVKPPQDYGGKWRSRIPSAEMIECTVIFTYGASNVFLEHLAGRGGAWSHGDLEHVSIAFMFFGAGLCGMLVESQWIRNVLNQSIITQIGEIRGPYKPGAPRQPNTTDHKMSLNPLPALVIFCLGVMMSQHHQSSALSTKIHAQWGALLATFGVFRLFTYVLLYLSPLTSYYPSRPPTETIGSFCLMAGGLVFMASNKDTVAALERANGDAMFVLTVIIGSTVLIMSWITCVMAIKGWALRKEQQQRA
ncbi:unnamed protein product [Tuber melanosporum]|uniref:(Perigord truffle) hypothetical protein n=1 Tax=Tuber melanosporum (strain Mel28) TaxID=656061 RepID=D5GGN9_TUBMM|nr:uncharacterized protein GSTUM_00007443001 [Tuber melanosporum]CAZ83661.1 unnamed protein product [Tuber melanosporum]